MFTSRTWDRPIERKFSREEIKMNRLCWAFLGLGMLAPVAAVAQFFAPGFGASTAAEGYQRGFADVVRSAGEANLMDSLAAQNYVAARSQDIQNRVQWTEAYYQMRRANRAYRESKRSPRLSQEEIARNARQGLPRRLTSAELDPLTGEVNWPVILQESQYASEREQLEKLFGKRAEATSVSPDVYREIKTNTDELLATLKKSIAQYKPNDWLGARKFVESLAYEVRFPTG
jgi:hypothetical protein